MRAAQAKPRVSDPDEFSAPHTVTGIVLVGTVVGVVGVVVSTVR
jgi:hypothetical protein